MSDNDRSREHHWWPVGLQKHWADKSGDVYWVNPDGKIKHKRAKNRKIGRKSHGHTMFRDSCWETNFESEFDIDDKVHTIVAALEALKPFERTPAEFIFSLRLLFKKNRSLKDFCKFYHLEEQLHRNLLLLIYSLLIRSPANRSRYESYPKIIGLPPNEDVGKANMRQNYLIAKELCQKGLILNQYFVLLHSPLKKFIFGDGSLDWLSNGLAANRINGRSLISLTPHLCIYFCTPMAMRPSPNCASLSVAPWMVDQVNEITQIYSKDKLFFLGKPPKLTDVFRQREFREHKERTDIFFGKLDEIAGMK